MLEVRDIMTTQQIEWAYTVIQYCVAMTPAPVNTKAGLYRLACYGHTMRGHTMRCA